MILKLSFLVFTLQLINRSDVGECVTSSEESSDDENLSTGDNNPVYNAIQYYFPFSNARDLMKIGRKLQQQGDRKQALSYYDKAISKNNRKRKYFERRGKLNVEMKKWSDAVRDLKRAKLLANRNKSSEEVQEYRLPIDDDEIFSTMARNEYQRRHLEDTIWCYTEAIKRNPSKKWNYLYRGECHLKMKNLEKGIADYMFVLQLDPKAVIRVDLDHLFEALKSSGRTCAEMTEDLNVLLKGNEWASLGDKFHKLQKNYDEAIWCFNEAIKKEPRNPTHYRSRGLIYSEKGDINIAISEFEKERELDPYNKLALQDIIKTLHENSRFYELSDAMNGATVNDYVIIARDYMAAEKYEPAIWAFTKAIDIKPAATYHHFRSLCHLKLNDIEEAIEDLRISIQNDPKETSYRIALIETLINWGHLEEATQEMTQLSWGGPLFELGEKFAKKNRCNEAILCFDGAIRHHSRDPSYYSARASCYKVLKKWDEAILDLNLSLHHSRIDERTKCIRKELFKTLIEAGRYEEAKEAIETYEKTYEGQMSWGDSSEIKEARAKIAKGTNCLKWK